MNQLFFAGVGGVISADTAVPEQERMLRFYSRVLTTGATPLWREDLMNNLGLPIIGLGERTDAYAELPLRWMPHIQVADVGASVQRALELGATAPMQSKDANGTSQWAVLIDPDGAAFGLIPVVPAGAIPPPGPDVDDRVGRILWLDLTVPNASATRDFYQQVIGWSSSPVEVKDGAEAYSDYNMLGGDGTPAAGICHARGVNLGLPPVWMLYLPVGDMTISLRRVEEEGGKIIKAMHDKDGAYTYAAVEDPLGMAFALIQG